MMIAQYVLDAMNVGGLYALMALGIGLIFGIARLINVAHGELIMVGGYTIAGLSFLPAPLVLFSALVVVVALALMIERVAFKPLTGKDPATLLVASFAVSYLLQNLAIMIFGARPIPFGFAPVLATTVELAGLRIPILQFVSVGLTVSCLLILVVILRKTPVGVRLRAAAEDVVASRLCGVEVNKVVALAFGLSAALAWAVSLIFSAQLGQLSPLMGMKPITVGFVATILGGLGSLGGATLGGFLVGVISVLLDIALPPESRPFREAFLFGLVFIFLIVRPQGIIRVRALEERV